MLIDSTTPPPADGTTLIRRDVDRRVREGASLSQIDAELVRPAPVDDEHRSALWLHAWLHEDRGLRPLLVPPLPAGA